MDAELKRTSDYFTVKMGDEKIKVYLGDMSYLRKLKEIYTETTRASKADDIDVAVNAVRKLILLVFGEQNYLKIASFFGNNDYEMIEQCLSFIGNNYLPELEKSVKKKSEELAGL